MTTYEPLKAILHEMILVYEKLLELGKEKQATIIKGDPEALLSIFPKESALLKEIRQLEEKRQEETLSYQSLSLSQIIDGSSSIAEKDELLFYQSTLKEKLKGLVDQHQLNQELIENSLVYINNMLALYTQPQEPSNTYTASKHYPRENNQSRSFFDAKV
ncbi:flagellar protein FlgN [Neobacillus sp. OS1-33]|jgi:flagellar biosynthesis/type III secretory pathway chaperone|uniref:flagellar protein FlgN n=1 Tax=Neobacillus sp. OS1-33 TaxID=3070683 RepID=UPI0027DEE02F|nr:flagellar protein FlgN [Neobacillus sp. OS1-33]WML24751.1 flagellar protein FlgN [Neobacillus sp. OS1-33]